MARASDRRTLLRWGAAAAAASVAAPPARLFAAPGDAAAMAEAARQFLASLSEGHSGTARLAFADPARTSWHWFPSRFYPGREGVPLNSMSGGEREAALALLAVSTTPEGRRKALEIVSLQGDVGGDPGEYWFSVYGDPAGGAPWGWGMEGHHLSLNYTVLGDRVAAGPIFLGAWPNHVTSGPRAGLKAMDREEAAAREIVTASPAPLRERAIFAGSTPGDTTTRNAESVAPLEPAGVRAAELPAAARDRLGEIVAAYTSVMPPALAAAQRAAFTAAAPEAVSFGWAGGLRPGELYYYRLQAPGFVIEHDNSRNEATHIHSVWRGFGTDFGRGLA